jgi:hypothetical protein
VVTCDTLWCHVCYREAPRGGTVVTSRFLRGGCGECISPEYGEKIDFIRRKPYKNVREEVREN